MALHDDIVCGVSVILLSALIVMIGDAQAMIQTQFWNVSAEAALVGDLLSGYPTIGDRPIIRPRRNSSSVVKVGLRLITLEVNEKHQTLKSSVWLRLRWYDDFLTWRPEKYAGIQDVILPHKSVWMPENIGLSNTAEAQMEERRVDLQVNHKGRVFYAPHRVFNSACRIDLTNYPFDTQTCHLWIQSASRYDFQMDLWPYYKDPFDLSTYLSEFKEASEWEIMSNNSSRHVKPRESGSILMYSRRTSLRFSLTLRRRLGFTAVTVMAPCVFLSLLTSVVFCLPPERPDRHMLAMSLFASYMVLLLILIENAPPSAASIPKLGHYYVYNLLLIIAAIFCSVFVISVNRLGNHGRPPPAWLTAIMFKYLHFIVCSRGFINVASKDNGHSATSNEVTRHASTSGSTTRRHPVTNTDDTSHIALDMDEQPNYPHLGETHNECFSSTCDVESSARIAGRGHQCCMYLHYEADVKDIYERHKVHNGDANRLDLPLDEVSCGHLRHMAMARRQWRAVTHILDRMFALLFFIVNIVALALLFPWPV